MYNARSKPYTMLLVFLCHLQSKECSEPELEALCQHLGHTLKVHQRWYRMRDPTIELAKVGKMLLDDK